MLQCLRTLEQRVRSLILSGVLGASVLGSGCVAGPDGTTALQRAFTQRGSVPSANQPPLYGNTTPLPPPAPSSSTGSSDANAIATGAEILSIFAPTLGGKVLFGGIGAYARTEAQIEGQKEAAGIIRDGMQGQGGGQGQNYQTDGVAWTSSREFGRVEFVVASRHIDYNNDGNSQRNEVIPGSRIKVGGPLYFACTLHDGRTFYRPMIKLFTQEGKLIEETLIGDDRIEGWCGGSDNHPFSKGRYVIAFFGQVPAPKNIWEQTPPGKQGVNYFLHAMPFEVVDE